MICNPGKGEDLPGIWAGDVEGHAVRAEYTALSACNRPCYSLPLSSHKPAVAASRTQHSTAAVMPLCCEPRHCHRALTAPACSGCPPPRPPPPHPLRRQLRCSWPPLLWAVARVQPVPVSILLLEPHTEFTLPQLAAPSLQTVPHHFLTMASAVRSKVLAAVAPLRQSAVGKMAEEQICALPGKLKQGKADWGAHLKALDEAGLIKKKPEEFAKLKEMVSASRKYQCVPFVRARREDVRDGRMLGAHATLAPRCVQAIARFNDDIGCRTDALRPPTPGPAPSVLRRPVALLEGEYGSGRDEQTYDRLTVLPPSSTASRCSCARPLRSISPRFSGGAETGGACARGSGIERTR